MMRQVECWFGCCDARDDSDAATTVVDPMGEQHAVRAAMIWSASAREGL